MSKITQQTHLISAIAELNEELALNLVRERLSQNDDPELILANCQDGMLQVGERYMQHQYYLSIIYKKFLRRFQVDIRFLLERENSKQWYAAQLQY